MSDPPRFPFQRSDYDAWLIHASREAVERSRELLARTAPLVSARACGRTADPEGPEGAPQPPRAPEPGSDP